MRSVPRSLAIVLLSVCAGCAAGPEFVAPPPPQTDTYTEGPVPEKTVSATGTAGAAQRFVSGRNIPAEWWEVFHSKPLNDLIQRALTDSPTLASAQAALRSAQENVIARAGAALVPTVDTNISARRQKVSGATFGGAGFIYNLFNASVDVSYALDLAGGSRRGLEALRATVDYQRFQIEGAALALAGNIVTAAIREASLRAQIAATRSIIDLESQQLAVVQRQFELGAVTRADVLAQRTQLAQTRATLPDLQRALASTRHQLAVLAGRPPSAADLPEFDLESLHLPEELPVTIPAALARQRPDIRASEALLHQASALIGVATANLYPQLNLTGSLGSETSKFERLLQSGTGIWGMGASLLQPLFHGGELLAKRRAAIDQFEQAKAEYRETILLAFRNVADVLRALEADAQALAARADADADARDTLAMRQAQLAAGAVSSLTLLDAERQVQQTRLALIQARAARFADTAALFQALGGGWWNREGAAPGEVASKKE